MQKLVGFRLNNVAAERRGQCSLVRLHIKHVFDGMAKMTDPGAFEIVQDHRYVTPFGDFIVSHWVIVERAENDRRRFFAYADCHPREFGDRAEIVVAQLHVG